MAANSSRHKDRLHILAAFFLYPSSFDQTQWRGSDNVEKERPREEGKGKDLVTSSMRGRHFVQTLIFNPREDIRLSLSIETSLLCTLPMCH
jgi:hypothetical protein